jgi:hypothetical protein
VAEDPIRLMMTDPTRPNGDSEEPAAAGDGVDVTLIRWMLSLTLAERLQAAEEMANFILEARAHGSIPGHPADTERT